MVEHHHSLWRRGETMEIECSYLEHCFLQQTVPKKCINFQLNLLIMGITQKQTALYGA